MQLSFSFSSNIDIYDARNFIVHDGNRDIFDFVTSSLLLSDGVYFLTGPEKSGKTYICNIWHRLKNATFIDPNILNIDKGEYILRLENIIIGGGKYILEDIETLNINDEYLLYLINMITEKKAILLITGKKYIHEFNFKVEDLKSRLNSIFNFTLSELNDSSKEKIILKLLVDRQMNIDHMVLSYITRKISGNYTEITSFVDRLEETVNSNKLKRITLNNIRSLL